MKNKHSTWALPALVVCIGGCSSTAFKLKPVDLDNLRSARSEIPRLQEKYPEERAVFLHREQTHEHSEEFSTGYWSAKAIYILRYVVFDPTHEPLTTFKHMVDKGWELARADIVVLPPDGKERRFKRDDLIEEKRRGGRRTYKLAYPKVVKGTLIEERIELFCPDPADAHGTYRASIPLRFYYPTLRAVAGYSYPRKWSVLVKSVAPDRDGDFSVSETGNNRVIRVERSNVPPQPRERYSPYLDEDGDYLRLYVNFARTSKQTYHGSATWKQRAKRHLKYVVDNDAVFSRMVTERAREVTRGARSDLDRLRAITEYAQQEIQSDEEFEPKDFVDVLKTKRGTPWQVVGLAHQMARAAGLDARYLMIHSAKDGFFDRKFISPVEPSDAALLATIDGTEHFGFPTVKWLPVDTFLKWYQGRPAYSIGPDGFDGFVTLPVHKHEDRAVLSKASVKIGEDGSLHVEEVVTFRGVRAFDERKELADLKPAELDRRLRDDLLGIQGDVTVRSVKVVGLKEIYEPLQKIYSYRIQDALTMGQGEAILQSAGIFSSSVRKKKSRARKSRIRPMVSYADRMYRREMTLTLPEGWTPSKTPPPFSFKNRCGEVRIDYASSPGLLRATKSFKENRFRLPAKDHEVLEKYLGARSRVILPNLVFKLPRVAGRGR